MVYWLVVWNMNFMTFHRNNSPNWLIFFRGVGIQTTRYPMIYIYGDIRYHLYIILVWLTTINHHRITMIYMYWQCFIVTNLFQMIRTSWEGLKLTGCHAVWRQLMFHGALFGFLPMRRGKRPKLGRFKMFFSGNFWNTGAWMVRSPGFPVGFPLRQLLP